MDIDREMETALTLDGVRLEQMTGQDHGPWAIDEHDWDLRITTPDEEQSLDDAAREAIERANCGPVFGAPAPSSDGREALLRVIGMLSTGDAQRAGGTIAQHISFRQSATETPADFIRRLALALLSEMAGVE